HSLALIACRSCLRHPLSSRLPYTTLFREIDAPAVMPAERRAALRQVQLADSVGTEMWLGRAALESEAGSLDSAATYLERYIREGGDAGVGGYRLARARYRLGDKPAAIA